MSTPALINLLTVLFGRAELLCRRRTLSEAKRDAQEIKDTLPKLKLLLYDRPRCPLCNQCWPRHPKA